VEGEAVASLSSATAVPKIMVANVAAKYVEYDMAASFPWGKSDFLPLVKGKAPPFLKT